MFFLLNALLIVQARPYSDNTTDIVIKFNTNDTFKPVETNSDTLIVANEENDTPEEIHEKSNTHMEAILSAEKDRDHDLSKKVMDESKDNKDEIREKFENANETQPLNRQMEAIMTAEQDRDKDISKKNTNEHKASETSYDEKHTYIPLSHHQGRQGPQQQPETTNDEKQLNITSSLLDSIIDSEMGREETLTDILFRSQADFVELPKFEFLIATKINESDNGNKSAIRNENSLDRNSSDVLKKVDYVELVEVGKPKMSGNNSAYSLANITANEIDNDVAPDTSEYC